MLVAAVLWNAELLGSLSMCDWVGVSNRQAKQEAHSEEFDNEASEVSYREVKMSAMKAAERGEISLSE